MGLRSYLERRARQRIEKRLGPLMRAGEKFLEFDIGKSVLMYNSGTRFDFIATNKALYIYEPRTNRTRRLPYEEIGIVHWEPDSIFPWFSLVPTPLHEGSSEPINVRWIGEPRPLASLVKDRVNALVTFERHVSHRSDGKGATYRLRPWEEGGELMWDVRFDEEIEDPESEEMQTAMKETVEQLAREMDFGMGEGQRNGGSD